MAKKSKSKGPAPAEWQGAVDASAAQDGTGVVHEDGIPKVIVELTDEQRDVVADESARLVLERAEVDKERLNTAREYRNRIKGLDDRIRELAGEYSTRRRKVPAQQDLPGTVNGRQAAQAGAGQAEA